MKKIHVISEFILQAVVSDVPIDIACFVFAMKSNNFDIRELAYEF